MYYILYNICYILYTKSSFLMAQGLVHASNMQNIPEEVQHVCNGNCFSSIQNDPGNHHQVDILISMRIFKNVLRWKEFCRDQKQESETKLNEMNEEEESRSMATGLNINLKPTFGIKNVKHVATNLEGFLKVVGKILLKEAFKRRCFKRSNKKTREIYRVI